MTQSAPAVSVVLIFLEGEEFLAEAIESVLAQTFADWELVLVDDGSSGPATGIARDYARRHAPKIRYLDHPDHANLGRSASRNAGVRASGGAVLTFIDCDDVWAPEKLEQQTALLNAYPQAALVCGALLYWRSWSADAAAEGGEDRLVLTAGVSDRLLQPPEALLRAYPLGDEPGAGVDCAIRREVFETAGGFEEGFRGMYDDQALLLKLFLQHPVYISGAPWVKYRQHARSCVAVSYASGRYEQERTAFLDWFSDYLVARTSDRRVLSALERARQTGARRWIRTLAHRIRRRAGKIFAATVAG